jgi:TonB family protein
MSIRWTHLFIALLVVSKLFSQTPADTTAPVPIGPGVTPPRLLHKVEPKYSNEARADHVQGTVVLQLVIDEKGNPTKISVISPLGFGLDEQAQMTIEKWRFTPGTKGGKPVSVRATVAVNFRFPDMWFDQKAERQRTSYNLALENMKQDDKTKARAIETIQELSRSQFPAAMYMAGMWEMAGENVTKDPADGLALIRKAAEKKYGPAMFEVALRQIEGRDIPADVEEGLDTMRKAALLGSRQAQFHLGARYEKGKDVPLDTERAQR